MVKTSKPVWCMAQASWFRLYSTTLNGIYLYVVAGGNFKQPCVCFETFLVHAAQAVNTISASLQPFLVPPTWH